MKVEIYLQDNEEVKKMIIQYASDLHLEFPENKAFLRLNPLQPQGEILLLAGDIVPFAVLNRHKDFFNYLSDHFKTTWWIPGNHEYYHFDMAERSGGFKEDIKPNVHLVNNVSEIITDTRFIFSTLWSKINPGKQWFIEKSMGDFQVIKHNGFRFSIDRFNEQHELCLAFVTEALTPKHTGKTIVVTHHVPTLMHYPEQYKTSELNEAFAVELFELIEKYQPDYWIYGHHHSNTPEFEIGKTKLLTNQLGYVKYGENKGFDANRVITI